MAAAVKSSAGTAGKKSRKPYVMTRPRERWTADEHDRFLHALLLYGRDWKRVQAFVATKTGYAATPRSTSSERRRSWASWRRGTLAAVLPAARRPGALLLMVPRRRTSRRFSSRCLRTTCTSLRCTGSSATSSALARRGRSRRSCRGYWPRTLSSWTPSYRCWPTSKTTYLYSLLDQRPCAR